MSESGFRHSQARVPRLYKEAGRIIKEVKANGGSVKGLLYKAKHKNSQGLFALVTETLRHDAELDKLLRQTGILVDQPRLDPWVTRVLMTELLWRDRPLAGAAIPLQIVRSYKSEFLSKQGSLQPEVNKSAEVTRSPRFVRINTLKTSEQEIIEFFLHEGWQELKDEDLYSNPHRKYEKFVKTISRLNEDQFMHDAHVPNLLVFPRSLVFHNLDYYRDGCFIIQDKASCMPAFLLNAPPGSTVLDMCAAPGMKTTHVAACINNIGTVHAIERDTGRYETLCNIVSQAGASCVKPILGDALQYSDKEIPNVEYILVDPSCSGSGMKFRSEVFNESQEVPKMRLERLASFQRRLLEHAMTKFPKAKRIIYSTCSIHPEENESVVDTVLMSSPPNFVPIIPNVGTDWMTRGSADYKYGEYGLYAKPEDMTNGFFLTVFERTENEYVSEKIINSEQEVSDEKKEKRKRKKSHSASEYLNNLENGDSIENVCEIVGNEEDHQRKKKKKKKKQDNDEPELLYNGIEELKKEKELKPNKNGELPEKQVHNGEQEVNAEMKERKKRQKSHSGSEYLINSENRDSKENVCGNLGNEDDEQQVKKKKKKKRQDDDLSELLENSVAEPKDRKSKPNKNAKLPDDLESHIYLSSKEGEESKGHVSPAPIEYSIQTSSAESSKKKKKNKKSKSNDACDD